MSSFLRKIARPLKNSEGFSLLIVLFALVIVSILGISMISIANNNLIQSSGEQNSQAAFYIAEGGVTQTMKSIEKKVLLLKEQKLSQTSFFAALDKELENEKQIATFSLNSGKQPIAKVNIDKVANSSPRQYKVVSTGIIGKREREVTGYFTIDYKKGNGFLIPSDLSLYTEENVELVGGAKVNGSVGTNLKTSGSIKLDGGAGISKQIFVPSGSSSTPINAPPYLLTTHITKVANFNGKLVAHTLPLFPAFPTYMQMNDVQIGDQNNPFKVINQGRLQITQWQANNYVLRLEQNSAFKEINVDQNNILIINLGNKDREIVVDNFNLINGEIKIMGTGKLTVYVKNNMTFGSGKFNINGDKKNLEIFLKGTPVNVSKKQIVIAADMKINGSLYAENANLTFTAGGGFLGHVLSGGDSLIISGGARVGSSLILAPKAKVQLLAGGSMNGAIISKSYFADGGTTLNYVQIDHTSIPEYDGLGSSKEVINFEIQSFRES